MIRGGTGSTNPMLRFPHRGGRYEPGEPPLFSPFCWSCRCKEGFLIRGWDLILTGWRCLYEPQLGVSTPSGAVSTMGTSVFIPGLLKLSLYGRISDPGMGSYPPWMAMALRTPGWGVHTVGGGIDPGGHHFRPRFFGGVDVWKQL